MHGSTDWDSCCQCGKSVKGSQASEEGRWRIILDADRKTAPSITLFNNLNSLPFTKQSLIKRLTLVYNRLDNNFNTPIYIDNLLITNSDIHQREARYSDLKLLCAKHTRKTEGGRTFRVRTIAEGNAFDPWSIRKELLIAKCWTDQKASQLLKIWGFFILRFYFK